MKRKFLATMLCVVTLLSLCVIGVSAERVAPDQIASSIREVEPSTAPAPQVDPVAELPEADTSALDSAAQQAARTSANSIIYPDGITFRPATPDGLTLLPPTNELMSAYANYSGSTAASYAVTYAESPNSQYKKLDLDCTNFVSQCVAVGGVYSYISNFTGEPSILKDWIMETNNNAWYMIKKTRSVWPDYWVYSNTWGFVDDFRNFHVARSAAGSNTFYGKLSGGTPNTTQNETTNFEYKLRKNAQVGQVWQLSGHHSVIITSVQNNSNGYNYVWYSAHSDPAKNKDIQNFLDYCYGYQSTSIYRLKFS